MLRKPFTRFAYSASSKFKGQNLLLPQGEAASPQGNQQVIEEEKKDAEPVVAQR